MASYHYYTYFQGSELASYHHEFVSAVAHFHVPLSHFTQMHTARAAQNNHVACGNARNSELLSISMKTWQ